MASTKSSLVKKPKKKPELLRLAIAQDALKYLEAGKFILETNVWLESSKKKDVFTEEDVQKKRDLRIALRRTPKCRVCALGAIFAATVLKHDALSCANLVVDDPRGDNGSFEGPNGWGTIVAYLEKFFSNDQLILIEMAFEGSQGHAYRTCRYELDGDLEEMALGFFEEYKSPKNRMIAILQNIIRNRGVFSIEHKYM